MFWVWGVRGVMTPSGDPPFYGAGTGYYGTWTNPGLQLGKAITAPYRFCPHCGERLPSESTWAPSVLYETNEARVVEAESEGEE